MGFFGCFIGYKLIYKNIIGKNYSKKRIMTAAILGSVFGLQCGAFSVVLETLASGVTKLPFTTFVIFYWLRLRRWQRLRLWLYDAVCLLKVKHSYFVKQIVYAYTCKAGS